MIAVVIVCLARTANAVSREFENACHKGADARVKFHVVGDIGNPVPFAKVKVFRARGLSGAWARPSLGTARPPPKAAPPRRTCCASLRSRRAAAAVTQRVPGTPP